MSLLPSPGFRNRFNRFDVHHSHPTVIPPLPDGGGEEEDGDGSRIASLPVPDGTPKRQESDSSDEDGELIPPPISVGFESDSDDDEAGLSLLVPEIYSSLESEFDSEEDHENLELPMELDILSNDKEIADPTIRQVPSYQPNDDDFLIPVMLGYLPSGSRRNDSRWRPRSNTRPIRTQSSSPVATGFGIPSRIGSGVQRALSSPDQLTSVVGVLDLPNCQPAQVSMGHVSNLVKLAHGEFTTIPPMRVLRPSPVMPVREPREMKVEIVDVKAFARRGVLPDAPEVQFPPRLREYVIQQMYKGQPAVPTLRELRATVMTHPSDRRNQPLPLPKIDVISSNYSLEDWDIFIEY